MRYGSGQGLPVPSERGVEVRGIGAESAVFFIVPHIFCCGICYFCKSGSINAFLPRRVQASHKDEGLYFCRMILIKLKEQIR